jgi:hypothetical protein
MTNVALSMFPPTESFSVPVQVPRTDAMGDIGFPITIVGFPVPTVGILVPTRGRLQAVRDKIKMIKIETRVRFFIFPP